MYFFLGEPDEFFTEDPTMPTTCQRLDCMLSYAYRQDAIGRKRKTQISSSDLNHSQTPLYRGQKREIHQQNAPNNKPRNREREGQPKATIPPTAIRLNGQVSITKQSLVEHSRLKTAMKSPSRNNFENL